MSFNPTALRDWRSVRTLSSIDEVTRRLAELAPGWVTVRGVRGYTTLVFNQLLDPKLDLGRELDEVEEGKKSGEEGKRIRKREKEKERSERRRGEE